MAYEGLSVRGLFGCCYIVPPFVLMSVMLIAFIDRPQTMWLMEMMVGVGWVLFRLSDGGFI